MLLDFAELILFTMHDTCFEDFCENRAQDTSSSPLPRACFFVNFIYCT